MKKSFFAFLLVCTLVQMAAAQVGKPFPALSGNTLEDKPVALPENTKGKYTLLCLTYSQKSTDLLSPWFQPVYDTFVGDPDYDLNMYFVVMLSGIKELAAGTIEKKMKQGIDPVLHSHILLYKGEIGSYKQALNMPDKELPYFFLLDKDGKIIYQTSGAYSDKKLEEIESKIE